MIYNANLIKRKGNRFLNILDPKYSPKNLLYNQMTAKQDRVLCYKFNLITPEKIIFSFNISGRLNLN